MENAVVLLSDLGGTNARFELHQNGSVVCRKTYPTVSPDASPKSGSAFEALVAQFLVEAGIQPDICVSD
jgi:glucokinase